MSVICLILIYLTRRWVWVAGIAPALERMGVSKTHKVYLALFGWDTPKPALRKKGFTDVSTLMHVPHGVCLSPITAPLPPYTFNPKPETRIPKPEPRNPKPETRNPKPGG